MRTASVSVARKFFRYCLIVFSVLLILSSAVLLGVRYFVLPNVNQWRPQIQDYISQTLDLEVSTANLSIGWRQGSPVLTLQDVAINNEAATEYLKIKSVSAGINWQNLLRLRPFLSEISIEQAALNIRRDANGHIRLLGQKLTGPTETPSPVKPGDDSELSSLAAWLGTLTSLSLNNADLIWLDEQRQAPPLGLSGVTFAATRHNSSFDISFFAQLPEQLGKAVTLQARLESEGVVENKPALSGLVHSGLTGLSLLELEPWLTIPDQLKSGYVNQASISFGLKKNEIADVVLETELRSFRAEDHLKRHDFIVSADLLKLTLNTGFHNIHEEIGRLLGKDETQKGGAANAEERTPWNFSFTANQLFYNDKTSFNESVSLDVVHLQGFFQRDTNAYPFVMIEQGTIKNEDISVDVKGSWVFDPNSDNGIVDLQGELHLLSLPHLYRYLPNVIDDEALGWLTHAFKNGLLKNAPFRVKGVIDHFPFGQSTQSGDFQIRGVYQDLALDYHQEMIRDRKWPVVYSANGQFDFHRDVIDLKSEHAYFENHEGHKIDLKDFTATVSSIEKGTEVALQANSSADASTYLSFAKTTPLGYLIGNTLDRASASGSWLIPLKLFIPVNHADDAKVSGTIIVDNADFQFDPEYPWLRNMKGALPFDETVLQAQKLEGVFLGGPVVLEGNIGSAGKTLSMKGAFSGPGLKEVLSVKGMDRIKGQATYEARIDFLEKGRINVEVNSGLKGISLDFPNELAKKTGETKPLNVRWLSDARKNNPNARVLELDLDKGKIKAVFERNIASKTKNFFSKGAIGVATPAVFPESGLKIAGKSGLLDVQQWLDIVDEFESGKTTAAETGPVFPDVSALEFEADVFQYLKQNIANMKISGTKNSQNAAWNFRMDSDEVQGTVNWQPAQARREESVTGRFDYLKLNNESSDEKILGQVKESPDKVLNLPRLDIRAKQFFLADQELGSLELKGQSKQGGWEVNPLGLANSAGSLYATGLLTTKNKSTGLDLNLNLNFLDLGKLLSVLDLKDIINGGQGHINATLHWPDIIDLDLHHLTVSLDAQIGKGQLLSIDSKLVKALELLALQSITRIPDFGSTLGNSFKNGVSFDNIRAKLEMDKSAVHVSDFRLSGPAVAIVANGKTNIKNETLDFQAVAIPNLDVSGAAVLTGVIVNPVVGVGAFLSQWLLQAPLQRSLTAHYSVRGTWSEPIINDVALPTEEELKADKAAQKIERLYRGN
ncbi:MAG: AsmA family protein [Alcaligenaceae bacterium]|nr:AsmA family protein [Alcaligenaceae bacterium]